MCPRSRSREGGSSPAHLASGLERSVSQDWPVSLQRWHPPLVPPGGIPMVCHFLEPQEACPPGNLACPAQHMALLPTTPTDPVLFPQAGPSPLCPPSHAPSSARLRISLVFTGPLPHAALGEALEGPQGTRELDDPGAGEQAWPITSSLQRREEGTLADPRLSRTKKSRLLPQDTGHRRLRPCGGLPSQRRAQGG